MAEESTFQVLTIGEDKEVGSADLTNMMKSVGDDPDSGIDLSGGAKKLEDLEDVLFPEGLAKLHALLYDDQEEKFVNKYILLTDLIDGEPDDQNIIKWDAATETFVPTPMSEVTGVIVDGTTLTGSNDAGDPIRIHPDIINEIGNKLDRDYAHFIVAADESTTPNPPSLQNGEVVYFTNQYIRSGTSIKVTEHVILDWLGEKTVIKSVEETL